MKLIKINTDHYVIVDDSEISVGDFVAEKLTSVDYELFEIHTLNDIDISAQWKITHSTDINFNEVYYISLQEVKELIGEVDVEKKVKNYYENDTTLNNPSSFKAGYNQALEDNKEKKYTEEDVRRAIEMARDIIAFDQGMIPWYKFKFVDIIQSLQPKTEWEVELIDNKLKLK